MQTRKLGNTDLNLTVIGFGSWAIGGAGWEYSWGEQDDNESMKAIRRAMGLGINWIDTAPVYGLGHSEEIIGKALKGISPKPIIATKCSLVWNDKGKIKSSLKKESVLAEIEASLRRLQVETIDLYQVHWPNPDSEIEEGWETIAKLVEQGKIRYAAVSNFNVTQLKRAQAIHPVASLQQPYSILTRGIEKGILPFCAQNNIGVVTYSPMQKGILTNKFTREFVSSLPADDHRIRLDKNFKEPALNKNLKLVASLKEIAQNYNASIAQLAIAWVLIHPAITSAIVGARKPEQIEETVLAAGLRISEEDLSRIDAFLAEMKK